ncbi:MAG: YceI family protein [Aggregatilineales bacterium]
MRTSYRIDSTVERILWALICGLCLTLMGACSASPAATTTAIPTATASLSATATATLPPGSRVFVIQTTSSVIHYTVTSTLAGIQVGGTFAVTGNTVTLVPEANGWRLLIDIQIDGNSATGVNGLIVNALKGSLETDKFPYGYFEASAELPVGSDSSNAPIQATASGTIGLHGMSRAVQMPISLTLSGAPGSAQIVASGTATLSLPDFGVTVLPLIKNEIAFKADLIAQEVGGR